MGMQVALIDKSEITQKMISHSLHYYSAKIYQFENLDNLLTRLSEIKPDVIFVDWDLKKGEVPLALEVQKKIGHLPLIVLHRDTSALDSEIEKIKNRIKKPINAKHLRDLVARIVPKTKQFKIDEFLEFPQDKQTEVAKESTLISDQIFPNKKISSKKNTSVTKLNAPKKDTDTNKGIDLPDIDSEEDETLIRKGADMIDEKKFTVASSHTTQPGLELPSMDTISSEDHLIEKSKVINSHTPSPTASAPSSQDAEIKTQKMIQDILVQKGESLLLDVLKEYQNTQEFQDSLNKKIADQVNEKIEEGIQRVLEKELSVLKNALPKIAKDLIQKEISNLIEEN